MVSAFCVETLVASVNGLQKSVLNFVFTFKDVTIVELFFPKLQV